MDIDDRELGRLRALALVRTSPVYQYCKAQFCATGPQLHRLEQLLLQFACDTLQTYSPEKGQHHDDDDGCQGRRHRESVFLRDRDLPSTVGDSC